MGTKQWNVQGKLGQRDLRIEHGYFSGRVKIYLDGHLIKESKPNPVDFGSSHVISVDGEPYEILIIPHLLTFKYTLQKPSGNPEMSNLARRLPPQAQFLCGWPLLAVIFGGALGGALGGIAYALNVKIYKSDFSRPQKIFLNLLTGCTAFALWGTFRYFALRVLVG